jgi:hypothetical protein
MLCGFPGCSDHKPGNDVLVFASSGGSAFHSDLNCRGLKAGQSRVEARGGQVGEVQHFKLARAKAMGLIRCQLCFKN